MKWRQWAILIILVLLNYILFSTAFTQLAGQRGPVVRPTRTPWPTFESVQPTTMGWIVLPTHTPHPTRVPVTPTPTEIVSITTEISSTLSSTATIAGPSAETQPVAADTAVPPTAIPVSSPSRTPKPKPPAPTPAKKLPAPTSTPAASQLQFTAEIIWDPAVAPNCDGPAISKQSVIRDANGNPVNGVRVELNCYGNVWVARPSGNPGEFDPGHYDFSLGQYVPRDWTCTVRVIELNGQPVTSSEVVTIHFDTNNCKPDGKGHQIAIVNWTKHR